MKRAVAVLVACAFMPGGVYGAVSLRLVSDRAEMLAGSPYMGHLEMRAAEGGAVECECRLLVLDPCTVYEVRKPSGRSVTISQATVGISVDWAGRFAFDVPDGGRVLTPVCIGMVDGEPIFDEVGQYEVSVSIACARGEAATTASDKVVVTRRGVGYEQFVSYLKYQGPDLYFPCYWVITDLKQMQEARSGLGSRSEYGPVLDAVFAYEIGLDSVREVVRVAFKDSNASGLVSPKSAERDLDLGSVAALRAGVNGAFWEHCRSLYEWNVKRGAKYDESTTGDLWRVFE